MRFSIDRIMQYHQMAEKSASRRREALETFNAAKGELEAAEEALRIQRSNAHAINPASQREEDVRFKKQEEVFAAAPFARQRYEDARANYRECINGPLAPEKQWSAISALLRDHPDTPAAIRRII